ncbi:MAG: sulfite exporter TauE/SafE family protein, partial [Verrucomicrobiota bacterium]
AMSDFSHLLQQGASQAWLFIPSAILLGALHGLEPGHSKTMMAAFIIAVRGTILQAVLLGLAAAFSHSLVIWLLAVAALRFGSQWNAETSEPYFQLASALIIFVLALWMLHRTRRDVAEAASHSHGEEPVVLETAMGTAHLSIFEEGVPPVFRLAMTRQGEPFVPEAKAIRIETVRGDGERQAFEFIAREEFLESTTSIPEPHAFAVHLIVIDNGGPHTYSTEFSEHDHDPSMSDEEFQDAHEAAHARDIQKRFANREVTTGQIVLFGLTGGLLPCPAAFTVLIVCLQLKEFTLGFALVAAFSLGLALTMVTVGAAAAWSVHHARRKFRGFGELMRKAPYVSCALLMALAVYMAWHGWHGLSAHH